MPGAGTSSPRETFGVRRGATQVPSASEDTLAASQAQLKLYAQDLRKLLDAERERTEQLTSAHRQLLLYATELKETLEREQENSRQLARAHLDTAQRLNQAVRYKDNETANHNVRLSHYSAVLAQDLGWDAARVHLVFDAAPLHDLGKVGVPDAVLQKASALDENEWNLIKLHPSIGANLLHHPSSPLLRMAGEIAFGHHENWDGSGYPLGLRGDQISQAAHLVHVVDVYDALRSTRPYKTGFTHAEAVEIMTRGDGRTLPQHFEPRLIHSFQKTHTEFEAIYETYGN
jgi:putative two-component system response regulator